MKKYFSLKILYVMALAIFTAGCATTEFVTSTLPAGELSIRQAKVYAYSFLDLRDVDLGPRMPAQVNSQLVKALGNENVSLQAIQFKNTDVGRSFSTINRGMTVPVRQTIESNATAEDSFGADYRLVIFPSSIVLSGAWKFYDIRWELTDIETGNRVWSSVSKGKHLTFWKNDEDPEGRAKVIVDGAVSELKRAGLI